MDKPIFGHGDLAALTGGETAFYDENTRMVILPDWNDAQLDVSVLNYAKYIKEVRLDDHSEFSRS